MERDFCPACGGLTSFAHDHQSDSTGLDDGPLIRPARKKPAPKTAAENRDIRGRAWVTRRQVYGQQGHR